MTDYIIEGNILDFIGPTSVLLQDTLHLFKKDYWYKIEYTIEEIISTCTVHISDYSFIENSIGNKKYILKITDDLITNYIQLELDSISSIRISNLKISIFGLVDFGINRTDLPKGIFKTPNKIENFSFNIPNEKETIKKIIYWDGINLTINNYDEEYLQTIVDSPLYFVLYLNEELSQEQLQHLRHWIKQTF